MHLKNVIIPTLLMVFPTIGLADMTCSFDRYCQTGEACLAQDFIMTIENSDSPAFVWDGPTRKPLAVITMTGDTGVFISSSDAGSTTAEVWALAISRGQAALSLSYATFGNADSATYLGTCDGTW